MTKRLLSLAGLIAMALVMAVATSAQAIWLDAGASKTWQKKYTVGIDAQYRTSNKLESTERWGIGANFGWKPLKWLKVGADYSFLYSHRPERTTKKGNFVEDYWQPRHRVGVSLTGSLKFNRWELSLRERWQYTRNQGVNALKFGPDGLDKGYEYIPVRNRHVLRSRLKLEWGIKKKCPFTPYVSAEMYNSLNKAFQVTKVRYTAGCDYKIDRHNSVGLFYRFVDSYDNDETNLNVIGLEYAFKL